ncbi:MAG: PhaM family polyhydroxyalkanoate granule multifunctional regulatory protein [Caldimonas sp.]
MNDATGFTKLVPGFDFLQGLVKNAGSALPGIGQWVAPTLDPAELEKRITELRTVQYWLEQNARMLAATIQALEVQRMTLSTLKTMNVQMTDLAESLKIKTPAAADAARGAAPAAAAAAKKAAPKPGQAVDPMQWWGALTNQFAQLATAAMKDGAADASKALAGGMMKQSFDNTAAETTQRVAAAPGNVVAKAARKAGAKPAPAARRSRSGVAPR